MTLLDRRKREPDGHRGPIVTKRFGDFVALDDVSRHRPRRLADRAAGPERRRQVDAPAGDRRARGARRGRAWSSTAGRCVGRPAAEARRRLRLPALRRLQAHDRARQRRLRPEDPQAPKAEIRARVDELLALVHLEGLRRPLPVPALRAASASAWRWPGRWPSSRSVLLLDEPFGALDARVRQELRDWLRRLHEEVHVTTIFVTHDQEEAMEVAEQIVVINEGRIEQAGAPDRPLREAREPVRHELRRAGEPARRGVGPPARRRAPARGPRGHQRRRSSSGSRGSGSRCAYRCR